MIAQELVLMNFAIRWPTSYGKAIYLIGNTPELGQWRPERASRLRHFHYDNWSAALKFAKGTKIQYKFFMSDFSSVDIHSIQWQNIHGNHTFTVEQAPKSEIAHTQVCSFNIRYLTQQDTGSNNWNQRKYRIMEHLNKAEYDIIGIQEAKMPQKQFLANNLKAYFYFGRARDLYQDEECGVFVKRTKHVVIEDHYDWISQSKKQGSVGYDAKFPRYFTSLLVAPRLMSTEIKKIPCLFVINVHLDHMGKMSKSKGIEQMVYKCNQKRNIMAKDQNYKLVGCIIMGDFNLSEGSPEFDILRKNSQMKFKSMRDIQGADKSFTFNGFQNQFLMKVGSFVFNNQLTIDHMYYWFAEGSDVVPLKFTVDKPTTNEFLSDHYSIVGAFGSKSSK